MACHRLLLRRIFAVLGLLYPHHFCQARRHVLHCDVSCLTCCPACWELRNCTSCWITCWQKVLCHWLQDDFWDPHSQILKRFEEISRDFKSQFHGSVTYHVSTYCNQICCNARWNLYDSCISRVSCVSPGWLQFCLHSARWVHIWWHVTWRHEACRVAVLSMSRFLALRCTAHCVARCQLDLYDLDFVIDVTINPPSSRLSAVLQCYSATVLHTVWDQHSWFQNIPGYLTTVRGSHCDVRCDMMWPVSSWNLSEPHAVAGSLGRE